MGRLNGRPRKARLDLTDTTEVAEILQDLRELGKLGVPWYRLSVRMGKPPNWLQKRCSEETIDKAKEDEYHLLHVDDALFILEFVGTNLTETWTYDLPERAGLEALRLKAFLLRVPQAELERNRNDPRYFQRFKPKKVKRPRLGTIDSAPIDSAPMPIDFGPINFRPEDLGPIAYKPGEPKMRFGPVRPSSEENPKLFKVAERARGFLAYVRVRYKRPPEADLTTVAGFVNRIARHDRCDAFHDRPPRTALELQSWIDLRSQSRRDAISKRLANGEISPSTANRLDETVIYDDFNLYADDKW